jgi:hypothetical protein
MFVTIVLNSVLSILVSVPLTLSQSQSKTLPLFTSYRGVKIGTPSKVVHETLGKPKQSRDRSEFYTFSKRESALLVFDEKGVLEALTITYRDDKKSVLPTPDSILGENLRPDTAGNIYKLITYPESGYWVSYSKSFGPPATVTITMMKLQEQP